MRAQRAVTMLVAMFVLYRPDPAAAQTANSWELSGGYSFLKDLPDRADLPGWVVGAAAALTDWLAVVADVGGNSQKISEVHLSTFAIMAGARASAKIGRLTEFGQLLAGAVRARSTVVGVTSTATRFALQPGAGLDYPLARRLGARLQIDFRSVSGRYGSDPHHDLRFVAALVYHGCCR